MKDKKAAVRECFVCGCTDSRTCPGGCAWDPARTKLPNGKDLSVCTRCVAVLRALARQAKKLEIPPRQKAAFDLGALSMLRLIREAEWSRRR